MKKSKKRDSRNRQKIINRRKKSRSPGLEGKYAIEFKTKKQITGKKAWERGKLGRVSVLSERVRGSTHILVFGIGFGLN